MTLCLLVDAVREANNGNAHQEVLILPYLPYGRADRRFTLGDCAGLKVFGSIIDGIGFDYVVTLDAHSPVAKSHVSNLFNVEPKTFINKTIEYLEENYKTTVLLPDKGASRYKKLLSKVPVLVAEKVRDPKTGVLTSFSVPDIGDAEAILIVDDICDGGGTFKGLAAEIRKQKPGVALFLYVTHGIFSKGYLAMLDDFDHVYTTDTFEQSKWSGVSVYDTKSVLDGAIENL